MANAHSKVSARVLPRVQNSALRTYTPEASTARPHAATRQLQLAMETDARVRRPQFAAPSGSFVDLARANAEGRLYRTTQGQLIELPEGMTKEEAAQLEAEALIAAQKLGQGPAPEPVPDVVKPPEKPAKTPQAKGRGGAKRGSAGGSRLRTAGVKTGLKEVGGRVARYLVTKARPVLARGTAALARLSSNEQTHATAAEKRQQADLAVVAPATEGQARSNDVQVARVEGRPAPRVDETKGQQGLTRALDANVPRNIEDVDNFKRDMKGQHIGAQVLDLVQQDKNAVVGTFNELEQTPAPTPPDHIPEPIPAPEGAPATAPLGLGQAAIPQLLPEHTDVSSFTNEADAKLTQEGVTQEQLDMVDSGDLATANQERKNMKRIAATEPAAISKEAKEQTTQVDTELKQQERVQRAALDAKRRQGLTSAGGKQKSAKSTLEKKRDEVALHINGVYQAAQDKVKKRLAALETDSMTRFDRGNEQATKDFESNVQRELEAYKDDRYSGWFGWARKAKDWLRGMDDLPRVKEIFETNRAEFVRRVNKLVADISVDNKAVIRECKEELAKAKAEIQDYVSKLGPALQGIGDKTAREINGELDAMDGFIRQKEEELQKALADKQQAAIKAIDEKIEKMKQAMSGALAKLGRLLLWAAKKFFTWALSKFGYSLGEIESIIDKGVAVLKAVFTKPIAFVKNLMRAAFQGFEQFATNFPTHLKDAVFDWLGQELKGIKLPSSWSLKGIVGVALEVIGVSYTNLRSKMVEVMGDEIVGRVEKTSSFVQTLVSDGIMAAWEQMKEVAEEMRNAFVDGVKAFIQKSIVAQAVKTLGALFVPGAGIVRAIIGIYDTVVFLVQRAKQIMKMISSFLSAISDIAAGNVSVAAQAMEDGLARGLSLVVGFLASAILRLSGITSMLAGALKKVRDPVDRAMLAVARRIAGTVRGLVAKGKSAVKKLFDWAATKAPFRDGQGAGHTVFVAESGPPRIMVASREQPAETFIDEIVAGLGTKFAQENQVAIAGAKKALTVSTGLVQSISKLPETEAAKQQPALLAANVALGEALSALLKGNRQGGKLPEKYLLEGMTGTFASMPRLVGDQLTPDHQPQAAVLQLAAKQPYFKGTKMETRAQSRAAAGYAINLFHARHVAGRTYGGKSQQTLGAFESFLGTDVVKIKGSSPAETKKRKQEEVIQRLRKEVKEDATAIKDVVKKSTFAQAHWADLRAAKDPKDITADERKQMGEISARIEQGEATLAAQDLDSLKESQG